MEHGGNNTGSFDITFQGLNAPTNATPISKHDSRVLTSSNPLEIITYKYTAIAADEIEITMGRTSGNITPRVEIYDPQGNNVYSGNASTIISSGKLQLNTPGVYTILTMDHNANATGSFYIKMEWLYVADRLFQESTECGRIDFSINMNF